ncbi:helix-turn-helix domain-containing protein [Pseudomonas aeruginosa]
MLRTNAFGLRAGKAAFLSGRWGSHAPALGTHRNTLLRRLERAQDLLPVRLADHRIQIAAALELVIWSTPLIDDDK